MEQNERQQDNKKAGQKIGGSLFVGCMFLGMAAGWFYNELLVGMFAGMGVGFVLTAVAIAHYQNKK